MAGGKTQTRWLEGGLPVSKFFVVVVVFFQLPAHALDDLVEQRGAVHLEYLPLDAGAENEQCRNRAALVVAQVGREHRKHEILVLRQQLTRYLFCTL